MKSKLNILVCDEDMEYCHFVGDILNKIFGLEDAQCFYCIDGNEILSVASRKVVNIIITELTLPGKDPYDLIKQLKTRNQHVKIVILSRYDNRKFVKEMFFDGVDAFLLKEHVEIELAPCLAKVTKGEPFMGEGISIGPTRKDKKEESLEDPFLLKHRLTKREKEILSLLNAGTSISDIATDLYISEQTVSVHRKNILNKFGVKNTPMLLHKAEEKSILS